MGAKYTYALGILKRYLYKNLSALLKLLSINSKAVATSTLFGVLITITTLFLSLTADAQQPVQVLWPLTSDSEAVYSAGIGSASFKAGPALKNFQYDSINGATATGWNGRNLDPNAYYEYSITPERDATIIFNRLKFEVSLSSVNMRTALYYSKDGFNKQSIPVGNPVFVGKKSSRDLLVETNITVTYPETLTIRVYGWSAPNPAINFFAGNVEFEGVIKGPSNAVNLSETHVNVNCNGSNTGSINLSIDSGTPPFTITWTGPSGYTSSSEDLFNLYAGIYSVTVADFDGHTRSISVLIGEPIAPLQLTETHNNVNCYGNTTGSVDLSVSGGTSPYTYAWTGPSGFTATTQDISNRPAGTYSVVVTDALLCTATRNVTITQPAAPLATTETHNNLLCYGVNIGSIDLTVTGGTLPYTYIWTGPGSFSSTQQDLSNLAAGTYSVIVTDNLGCTTTNIVIITQPAQLTLAETHTNVACYGNSTGLINLTVTGGTSPFTYNWTGPSGYTASNEDISNLAAGTYTVVVTDNNGCSATRSIIITQPAAPLTVTINSNTPVCQGSTLSLTSTVTGGTTPYTYSWNGPNSFASVLPNPSITNASPAASGTYQLSVTDGAGCISSVTIVVVVNPSLVASVISTSASTICNGDNSLVLSGSSPTGGTGTYSYQWQRSPNGAAPWTDIAGANGLTYSPGSLTSTVSFRLQINSSPCGPVYSNIITITVQPVMVPGTIEKDQTICYNTQPANLTSVNNGGGAGACGTPIWRWEYSIDGGANWLDAGQTTAQYIFSGPLTQTTQYRRFAGYNCNGVICYSISSSNIVVITVQGPFTAGTIAADQTICKGDLPAQLTGTAVSNPPSTISYQWQSSTDGTNFTNIAGATGQNYQPGLLNADIWYRRIVTSTQGTSSCTSVPSNVVRITVNNLDPGSILSSQTYCSGGIPIAFTSQINATGDGTITYQWQSSPNGTTGWSDIPGATDLVYTPPATTAWYRRVAFSNLNGVICSLTSNVLEIRLVNLDPMTISPASGSFCGGGDPPIIIGEAVVVSPPSGNISYQWEISIDNLSWTPIAGAIAKDYNPLAITTTTYYRRKVTITTYGVLCSAYSNVSAWNVYSEPGLTVTTPLEVCEGDLITIIASATNTTPGAIYTLEYVSGSYNITTQTNTTGTFNLDPTGLSPLPVGQQIYRVKVTNNDPLSCNDEALVTVEINDVPEITLVASCATGTQALGYITMTGVVTYPSGSWVEYSKDGGVNWQVSPIFTNLPIGTYTIIARNGLKQSCRTSLTGTIADQSVITYTYNICQGETVPAGGGLIAGSLCIEWGNGVNLAKKYCTDEDGTSTYIRSNSLVAPYTPGTAVQYIRYLTFRAPFGTFHFKDCNLASNVASFSLYEYPFVPQQPSFNFLRWTGLLANPCNLITWTGLDPNKVYVLVLNSNSPTARVCSNLELVNGDKIEAAKDVGDVTWYSDPDGNNQVGSGSPWNPIGSGGLANTDCGGIFTFYAGCAGADCFQPANFIVNPHATVVAVDKSSCSGSPVDVPLSATQICNGVTTPVPPGVPITYSWTATLISGNATGFTNCTDCSSLIQDVVTSTNNSTCPIIRYDITAKSGNCTGPVTTIFVTIINNNSMTPPVPPANATYTCLSDVPSPPVLTTPHACLGTLSATGVDTYNNGTGCPGNPIIITRTWNFVDACHLNIKVSQTITVVDDVPPTFTKPNDYTVYVDDYCQYSVGPDITGLPTNLADNCTPASQLAAVLSDQVVTNPNCENGDRFTITRTWTLADACGNKSTQVQIIHVKDNTPPTFTKPADIIIYADANCNYNASVSVTGDVTDEHDNCSGVKQATYTDAVDNTNPCHKIISRTWTLVDNCGISAVPQVQIIEVIDNTKPVFTTCPAGPFYVVINDITNQQYIHSGTAWDALATDNCTGVTYTYTLAGSTTTGPVAGSTLNGVVFNKGETTITWTASDACGNSQVCVFKVFVYEVTITKAGPATITPGQTITYTITIINNSPTAIPQVTIADVIPVDIISPVFTHNGSASALWTGSYNIPSLAGTHNIIISGKVSCSANSQISNFATMTYAVTAVITSNTVVTDIVNLLAINATPNSTTCPGAFDGGINLTVTGGTSPYTYLWTASNGGSIPTGMQDDEDLVNVPAGTYTVLVTDANGCTITANYIVAGGSDTEAPTFDTKGPFEFCVSNILTAAYDGAPEPAADIVPIPSFPAPYPVTWRRPDWYVVNKNQIPSTELDIINIDDNCCSEAQLLLNLEWTITFDPSLVPARPAITGNGQPSIYDPDIDGAVDEIILWGTPLNVDVTHTISYTITDCNNLNIKTTKTAQIVIKPRPTVNKAP